MESSMFYTNKLNRDRKVYIVNSDLHICEELSLLFRLEGFETSFFTGSESFISAMVRGASDVVIVDLDVGEGGGLMLLKQLKDMGNGILAVMTTSSPQLDAAVMAMRLGALDVMSTPIDKERLVQVVRNALLRDIHFGVMEGGRRVVQVRGFSTLTPREREVLQLITDGHSNKEAGRQLEISPRTVEVHRARVMQKMGARNTADLIRIVMSS